MNGDELREARLARGWNQQQLADASGVSVPTIGKAERGDRVSEASWEKIETTLGPWEGEVSDNGHEPPPTKDRQPKPRKQRGKPAARKGPFSLVDQIEFPYHLAANALAPRLPNTAGILEVQARPCAEAWDQFLYRYPALREKIEQGMIATDIVALIMAHAPIFQVALMETRQIQEARAAMEQTGAPAV